MLLYLYIYIYKYMFIHLFIFLYIYKYTYFWWDGDFGWALFQNNIPGTLPNPVTEFLQLQAPRDTRYKRRAAKWVMRSVNLNTHYPGGARRVPMSVCHSLFFSYYCFRRLSMGIAVEHRQQHHAMLILHPAAIWILFGNAKEKSVFRLP